MVIRKEKQEGGKGLVGGDEVCDRLKIGEYISGVFRDMWYKWEGYMDREDVSLEEIVEVMEDNWLKELELVVLKRNQDRDMLLVNDCVRYILEEREEEGGRICIEKIMEGKINEENEDEKERV